MSEKLEGYDDCFLATYSPQIGQVNKTPDTCTIRQRGPICFLLLITYQYMVKKPNRDTLLDDACIWSFINLA